MNDRVDECIGCGSRKLYRSGWCEECYFRAKEEHSRIKRRLLYLEDVSRSATYQEKEAILSECRNLYHEARRKQIYSADLEAAFLTVKDLCTQPNEEHLSEPRATVERELDISTPNIQSINGFDIDLHQVARTYRKNKLGAKSFLVANAYVSFGDAGKIIEELYSGLGEQIGNVTLGAALRANVALDDGSRAEMIGQRMDEYRSKAAAKVQRKNELAEQGIAFCPKCLSTSISANKKGFGIGKAVIGAHLVGGLGLMAGNIGAAKIKITCLKCGHTWRAGK